MREVSLNHDVARLDTSVPAGSRAPAASTGGADFSAALKAALDGVNASQAEADQLARAFQTRDDVSLEQTMVAIASANVSFQTAVQVRNRLVAAYNEIMNMQV